MKSAGHPRCIGAGVLRVIGVPSDEPHCAVVLPPIPSRHCRDRRVLVIRLRQCMRSSASLLASTSPRPRGCKANVHQACIPSSVLLWQIPVGDMCGGFRWPVNPSGHDTRHLLQSAFTYQTVCMPLALETRALHKRGTGNDRQPTSATVVHFQTYDVIMTHVSSIYIYGPRTGT